MQKNYLAIDIGASSGRHIVGWMENGVLRTEEVYRFPNSVQRVDGHLELDIDSLFANVKQGIRYEYNVSYQNEPEKYLAEEWITDEYALNKSKTKLNRISGKFRKATIDFADKTFDSATNTLGAQLLTTAPIEPVSAPQRETRAVAPMEGFVAFQADKIPSTILQMLPDNALQIKAVKGNTTDANVEWKGIGNMFGKTISTISISKDSPAYKAIGNNDVYRLSFSKPGTSADAPWIIIECRKQGETSEGQQTMLIGEITNVWIK